MEPPIAIRAMGFCVVGRLLEKLDRSVMRAHDAHLLPLMARNARLLGGEHQSVDMDTELRDTV